MMKQWKQFNFPEPQRNRTGTRNFVNNDQNCTTRRRRERTHGSDVPTGSYKHAIIGIFGCPYSMISRMSSSFKLTWTVCYRPRPLTTSSSMVKLHRSKRPRPGLTFKIPLLTASVIVRRTYMYMFGAYLNVLAQNQHQKLNSLRL